MTHKPSIEEWAAIGERHSGQVDRRRRLSYDDFNKEYMRPRRPVIIEDGLTAWRALTEWTPQYFRTNFPDKVITVQGTQKTLGPFIDEVLASTPERPSAYLSGCFVRHQFPEVAPHIEPHLKYTLPDRVRSRLMIGTLKGRSGIPELLIAGKGSQFRLHYDTLHALGFVTQIYGDKEFILFRPEDTRFLYTLESNPNFSGVKDPFHPDFDAFPLLAQATPIRFILKAGETIFNPAGWWHSTRLLTPSIAMVISTINASNWSQFVADVGRPRKGVPWPLAVAVRAYLHAVGAVLTVKEALAPQPGD